MTYKIAYLISAYKDPEHLQRLILALAYGVEEYVCFFVHIDAKVDEKPFLPICNKENVFLHLIAFGCNGGDTRKSYIKRNY